MNVQPGRHAVSGLSLVHWLRGLCALVLLSAVAISHGAPTAYGMLESPLLTATPTAEAAPAATVEAAQTVVSFNREIVVFRSSLLGVTAEDRALRTRANLEHVLDRAREGKLTVQPKSLPARSEGSAGRWHFEPTARIKKPNSPHTQNKSKHNTNSHP